MNKKIMLLALLAMGALKANGAGTIINTESVATKEEVVDANAQETIAAAEAPKEEAVQTNEKTKDKDKGCGCKR